MIIGVLRWGWVEVILRVSLEVILHNLLRHSSATVYVAGVVLGLGSLGAGGDRRLAVALVSFRCSTCLFDGCSTIL